MKKTALWVALVLVGLSGSVEAEHGGGDRYADFVGATTLKHSLNEYCAQGVGESECPVRIIQGMVWADCDTAWSPPPFWAFGIGGVKFCDIPRGATVELWFESVVGELGAAATITCPLPDQDLLNWNDPIGRFDDEGSTEVVVPQWCDEPRSAAHPDTTNLVVFVHTTDVTDPVEPGVYAPVEGQVKLRFLSTEGSG